MALEKHVSTQTVPAQSGAGTGKTKPYRLGIALSGGGARGFAHAGALMAIEDAGLKPDAVAGVSAGSVIAVLYAGSVKGSDLPYRPGGASGNFEPFSSSTIADPGASRHALTVAAETSALGEDSQMASFSSWGPLPDFTLKPCHRSDTANLKGLVFCLYRNCKYGCCHCGCGCDTHSFFPIFHNKILLNLSSGNYFSFRVLLSFVKTLNDYNTLFSGKQV